MRTPTNFAPLPALTRRRWVLACASLTLACGWAGLPLAQAAEFPAKPIKMIVPFPPGGSTDVAGRVLSQAMTGLLNQSVVVDNRSGAAGAVGMAQLANAAPDGYTLGVGGVGPLVTLKLLGREMNYDPEALVIVGHMGSLGLAIVGDEDLQANDIQSLIALAKASPGKLSYGTSGVGSPGHLAFEYLKSLTGIDLVHVPYRGDGPLTADLMGKQLDIGILTGPGAVAQAQNNRIKILAVTSQERSAQLPKVPTVAESGLPGYAAEIWNVMVAPKDTPQPVLERLNQALNAALDTETVRQQLAAQGLTAAPMSLPQADAFVRAERSKWGKVVEQTGAGLE